MRSHPADGVEHEELARALRLLPALDAEIVFARHVLEASSAEIAEALDLPASTIRWRLARALETLRLGLVAWASDAEARALALPEAGRWAMIHELMPAMQVFEGVWDGRILLAFESDDRTSWVAGVRFVGPTAPSAALARGFRRRVARLRFPPTPDGAAFEAHFDVSR